MQGLVQKSVDCGLCGNYLEHFCIEEAKGVNVSARLRSSFQIIATDSSRQLVYIPTGINTVN